MTFQNSTRMTKIGVPPKEKRRIMLWRTYVEHTAVHTEHDNAYDVSSHT